MILNDLYNARIWIKNEVKLLANVAANVLSLISIPYYHFIIIVRMEHVILSYLAAVYLLCNIQRQLLGKIIKRSDQKKWIFESN